MHRYRHRAGSWPCSCLRPWTISRWCRWPPWRWQRFAWFGRGWKKIRLWFIRRILFSGQSDDLVWKRKRQIFLLLMELLWVINSWWSWNRSSSQIPKAATYSVFTAIADSDGGPPRTMLQGWCIMSMTMSDYYEWVRALKGTPTSIL